MKPLRTFAAALCALSMTATAVPATAASSQIPWNQVVLRAAPSDGRMTYVKEEPGIYSRRRLANFAVTFVGPWTVAAKAAFNRAVAVWRINLNSGVMITVRATWAPLGPGVLGSAGPGTFIRDFLNRPIPSTWYPEALANKRRGAQLAPTTFDIVAQFSSNFTNWHFGVGPAPATLFDFQSVVMHELGHGLGFIGAGTVNGTLGTVRLPPFPGSPALPTVYDRFTRNGLNQPLINFPNNSVQLGNQLKSNHVWFRHGAAPAQRFRLFAPAIFDQGSSYSHLNEATYPRGNPNSLMTPQIAPGETIRVPGLVTKRIFQVMGW